MLRAGAEVNAVERRLNAADEGAVRADLRALPGHLDRIDGWIADGVLGGEAVNAADLQIATTSRLMLTIGTCALLRRAPGRGARDGAVRRVARLDSARRVPGEWLAAPRRRRGCPGLFWDDTHRTAGPDTPAASRRALAHKAGG